MTVPTGATAITSMVLLCSATTAAAQTTTADLQKHPKISSALVESGRLAMAGKPGSQAVADTVIIEPERGVGSSAIDRSALASTGAVILAESQHLIRAAVPQGALTEVADLPGVRYIRRPWRPLRDATISEGVGRIGVEADHARGVLGNGVQVAVVDGGFAGADRLPDDMPETWFYRDYTGDGIYSGTDSHGTACAEIIYDIAPEAELTLIRISDMVDFENAKDPCIRDGVDIVSYSASWLGSGFGDGRGLACEIVNDAFDQGVVWVNAAGNYAERQYSALSSDSDGDGWNDFGATGERLYLEDVSRGDEIDLWLTWNEWPGTSEDWDLYLGREGPDGTALDDWAHSRDAQVGSAPVEHIEHTVVESGGYYVAIKAYRISRPTILKLWSGNHSLQTNASLVGTIGVPADARGALAVGAIDQALWTLARIEPYSSRGPTADGRTKPDLVGPTGVSTVSLGRAGFSGTSAAAPHVAGVAALVKSADPSRTAAQIVDLLNRAAIDAGDAGKDNTFGFGRLALPPLISSAYGVSGRVTLSGETGHGGVRVVFTRISRRRAAHGRRWGSRPGARIG